MSAEPGKENRCDGGTGGCTDLSLGKTGASFAAGIDNTCIPWGKKRIFPLLVAPLPIPNGTGSPVNPIAVFKGLRPRPGRPQKAMACPTGGV
jgi:hypothetical protein